jgi:integrase
MGKRGNQEGSIRRRPDGRWEGRIRLGVDENGKEIRPSIYGKSREDVVDRIAVLRRQYNLGLPVSKTTDTVDMVCERFICDNVNRKPATIRSYRAMHKCHISPILGSEPFEKNTSRDIQQLIVKLKDRKIKASTIKTMISFFRVVWKWARKQYGINHDPFADIELPKYKAPKLNFIPPEQIKNFLSIEMPRPIKMAVTLAIKTGMRKGEILGLMWSDINFDGGYLDISRQVCDNCAKGETQSTKTDASDGRVLLQDDCIRDLREYKKWQDEQPGDYTKYGFVIATKSGTPVFPSQLLESFYRYTKPAWPTHIRFHDLRHTHATWLASAGVGQRVIQERLRHTTPFMSMKYIHVTAPMQMDALRAMNNLINIE